MTFKKWAMASAVALIAAQSFAASDPGQGTWTSVLSARFSQGDHSSGPDAFYDQELNVTWLVDTNQFVNDGAPASGAGWQAAMDWAAGLEVGGVAGWRLPTINAGGTEGCNWSLGGTNCGYEANTSTSELAHMFYVELGNVGKVAGSTRTNDGPFKGIQDYYYWSSTTDPTSDGAAWIFNMRTGRQDVGTKYAFSGYAWAVHDGDVFASAVPEPSPIQMLIVGVMLACIVEVRRKRLRTF